MEDGSLTYHVFNEKYDDLLHKHDDLSIILKSPSIRVTTYVHALFTYKEFLQHIGHPLLRKGSHPLYVYLGPYVKFGPLMDDKNMYSIMAKKRGY